MPPSQRPGGLGAGLEVRQPFRGALPARSLQEQRLEDETFEKFCELRENKWVSENTRCSLTCK